MGYFKTTADGRKLFFPWGVLGKGYVVASDADYERTRRMRKIFLRISVVLVIAVLALRSQDPFALYAVAAGYIAAYAAWTRFQVAGLLPAQERLTMREVMALHPKAYSPFLLWPLEIGALLFVIGGIVVLMKDPSHWSSELGGIVFFGLCAASFAYMLVLRTSLHRPGK
jgi:uncharacterized membrane protein YbhN (UPF0104 family)